MSAYAPSSTLTGYQLTPYTPAYSIDTILGKIEYSFSRKTLWTTVSQVYSDATSETAPEQGVAAFEFTIHRENASLTEVDNLEAFLDLQYGKATPFYFTAPDDGVVYTVIFKEDQIQYAATTADTKTYNFVLATTQVNNTVVTQNLGPTANIASAVLTIWAAWAPQSPPGGFPSITGDWLPPSYAPWEDENAAIIFDYSLLTTSPSALTYSFSSDDIQRLPSLFVGFAILGTLFVFNPPGDVLSIYDCYLAVTYNDSSTGIIRPTVYSVSSSSLIGTGGLFYGGAEGVVANSNLAVDADSDPPTTAATITRETFSGLAGPANFVLSGWAF